MFATGKVSQVEGNGLPRVTFGDMDTFYFIRSDPERVLRVVFPPVAEGYLAHRDSFCCGTRTDRERRRVRRIRVGGGNLQEHGRYLRLPIDTDQIGRLMAREWRLES